MNLQEDTIIYTSTTVPSQYPDAPCMEYLPSFAGTKSPSYVGKYTSTMGCIWGKQCHSYGHLPVITGYFYGIIHSINGVLLVLITDK